MSVIIKLPSYIAKSFSKPSVAIEGPTRCDEVARSVGQKYPTLRTYFINSRGEVRDSLRLFLNDAVLEKTETIPDGSTVEVIFQASGG